MIIHLQCPLMEFFFLFFIFAFDVFFFLPEQQHPQGHNSTISASSCRSLWVVSVPLEYHNQRELAFRMHIQFQHKLVLEYHPNFIFKNFYAARAVGWVTVPCMLLMNIFLKFVHDMVDVMSYI